MVDTVASARAELGELLRRDVPIGAIPKVGDSSRPIRHSAVLILFGALDRTPAEPSAPAAAPAELDVLLTRRADGMRHHPGQIAFPGGGVEAGDADRAATALREAQEETGLDPTGVEVLGSLPAIHVPVSNNLVTPVIGWWSRPSEVAADRTESVDVFRAPVAELLDPRSRGMSELRRGGSVHRGAAFELGERFGGGIVWGFTGILLASLFDELGWTVPWDRDRRFEVLG